MLSREICYKCHTGSDICQYIDVWDRSWDNVKGTKTVFCLSEDKAVSIYAVPPSKCPYKLEHAVAAGMSDA